MALLQPAFEGIEAADVRRGGLGGAVLQQLAASDGLALLLQHLLQVFDAQLAAAGQAPGGHLADALFAQAAAAVGELLEQVVREVLATGLGDAAQQGLDFPLVRQGQIQQGDALLELPGQLPLGGGDHQGVGLLAQAGGQVAQLAADAAVIAVAVKVVQHQQGPLFWW